MGRHVVAMMAMPIRALPRTGLRLTRLSENLTVQRCHCHADFVTIGTLVYRWLCLLHKSEGRTASHTTDRLLPHDIGVTFLFSTCFRPRTPRVAVSQPGLGQSLHLARPLAYVHEMQQQ